MKFKTVINSYVLLKPYRAKSFNIHVVPNAYYDYDHNDYEIFLLDKKIFPNRKTGYQN